jgi:hypothetical protein
MGRADLLSKEASETFCPNLSGATLATIADAQGPGPITNDDGERIRPEHFERQSPTRGCRSFCQELFGRKTVMTINWSRMFAPVPVSRHGPTQYLETFLTAGGEVCGGFRTSAEPRTGRNHPLVTAACLLGPRAERTLPRAGPFIRIPASGGRPVLNGIRLMSKYGRTLPRSGEGPALHTGVRAFATLYPKPPPPPCSSILAMSWAGAHPKRKPRRLKLIVCSRTRLTREPGKHTVAVLSQL